MKNVYRKLFTLICTMLVLIPVLAQEVDEATAQQRALNFLQKSLSKSKSKNGKTPAMNVTLAHTSKGDMGNNYYAYNIGKNEGFVLVSADEKAKEILAYSDYGSFAYTTIPSNVKWWLSQYDNQIANLRKSMQADTTRCANSHVVSFKNNGSSGAIISKNIANQAKYAPNHVAEISEADRQDITPMISTKWDQGYPYNSMIPILGTEYTGDNGLATGCVATAIAQILNYYKYPTADKGHGSNTYTKTFPDVGNITLTFEADFSNTTYDWDNMLNTYDGSESQASKDAVAKLMYHVGVANNMNYGLLSAGGSGSIIQNIPHALVDYLGIDKSTTCEDRSCYTNAAWEGLVYSELCQNRPILYSGVTYANEGHTFLCDGYSASDNHYHINWGWGGMCDGYYVLTATENEIPLQPSLSGVGGAGNGASYSAMQYIEKNFIPDQGGDYVCCIRNVGGYQIDRLFTRNGEVITVNGNIFNLSLVEKQITLGVRLTNIDSGENVYYEIAKDVNLIPNQGFSSFQFSISNLADGKYAVYPVYYESSKPGEWNDVLSASSAPVLNVGMDGTVENVDKSRLYLKCDALSILEPTELAGTSVSETKEYIQNGGSVPMIKIQGCVYADNCINEATLDYGFGIFKDGTLIATEVLRQYFGEGSSYFIYSPLSGYLDAPGTYKIKMIYRYLNEETYHYCYGANFGYVEIINDGTKLTASLKIENDLSDPNVCMTNEHTFIVGDDTQERNPETGCFDLNINQDFTNRNTDMFYFDMGLALLKNGEIIKLYRTRSNSAAPGWGWTWYGNIEIGDDIADGQYQLAGVSKLTDINEWKIGNYQFENSPIEIYISNGILTAIDSRRHGKDIIPPASLTFIVSRDNEIFNRSADGNFYVNMMMGFKNENENAYFFDMYSALYNSNNIEVLRLDHPLGSDYGFYSSFPQNEEFMLPTNSYTPQTYCIPQDLPDGTYTIQGFCKYVNSKKHPDWRNCPNKDGVIYNVVIKDNNLSLIEVRSSYNLTYKVDGADYKTIEYAVGTPITPEPAPTKTGYTFSGWSDLPATMPDHDVEVNGHFTVNQYTITFDTDGGSIISPITQDYGSAITAPANPTKTGYTFAGWDKDIPATMPAENVTIKAIWTINKYKLVYMVDGVVYNESEVEYNAAISPLTAPTKTGYTFSGWSEIPERMPDHDVTVTGSFSINPSAIITPGVSDGTEITDQNVNSIMEFSLTLNNVESVVVNSSASVQLYVGGVLKGIASIGDIIVNNGTITIKFSPVQSSSSKGMVRDFWHAVKATASDDVDVLVKIAANSFTLNGETIADEISYNYKAKASVAEQIDLALAIDDLKAISTSDEPVYNLNGTRVNGKVRKGIVIKSGKKYLVK